jgi:hypothetical protein
VRWPNGETLTVSRRGAAALSIHSESLDILFVNSENFLNIERFALDLTKLRKTAGGGGGTGSCADDDDDDSEDDDDYFDADAAILNALALETREELSQQRRRQQAVAAGTDLSDPVLELVHGLLGSSAVKSAHRHGIISIGEVDDYVEAAGNLLGTQFLFNRF